jgi:N4-gp56 family major capsid protein
MPQTTTGLLTSVLQTYYDKKLLMRAEKELVYKQLGRVGTVPQGEGKTIYWTRYTNMPAQTSTLTEGTDPTARGISAVTVSATLAEYGDLTQVTDFLSLTSFDNVINSAVELLGYQAGLSVDTIVRDVVAATTNVIYASGVANRTSVGDADTMTISDVRKAVRTLRGANAKPLNNGMFAAVVHPDVEYDLQGDDSWVNAAQYVEKGINRIYQGETAEMYGVKFLRSANAPVLVSSGSAQGASGADTPDVYQSIIFGEEAFGVSDLVDIKTIVQSPSKNSALELYSDIGWKVKFVSAILNNNFMVSVESAATA